MEPFEVIEYKGEEIRLYYDEDAESPREWDNVGTMVCWHRNSGWLEQYHNLGDEQPKLSPDEWVEDLLRGADGKYRAAAERLDYIEDSLCWHWSKEDNEYLPTQHFDLWLKAKNCVQQLRDEERDNFIILPLFLYDHSGITMNTRGFSYPWDSGQVGFIYCTKERAVQEWGEEEWRDRAIALLESEVEEYDKYLRGDVCGWQALDDSCWGYYDKSIAIDDAKAAIDYHQRGAGDDTP